MLAYFPVPYADELLYSVIARYGVHTGLLENHKAVNRDVFSHGSAIAVTDLPGHLDALTKNVGLVWEISSMELILNHTLAPFYLPFLNTEQSKHVLKSMKSGPADGIHTRCGIAASNIHQPIYLRYCPTCLKEQQESFGEVYWRRTHQLSGIDLCVEHHCRLIDSPFHFHPKNKHEYVPAAAIPCLGTSKKLIVGEAEKRVYALIGQLMSVRKLDAYLFSQWTQYYQNVASRLGLKKGCRVEHRQIAKRMSEAYSGSNLEYLVYKGEYCKWLVSLFTKHRKSFHPIRHLLAVAALVPEENIQNLFSKVGSLASKEVVAMHAEPEKSKPQSEVRKKRLEWLLLNRRLRYPGVKFARKSSNGGGLYAWLYRHDKDWLLNSLPQRKAKPIHQQKVDYGHWDADVVDELEQYWQSSLHNPKRQRLSQNHLLRQVSRSNSVVKHLAELPMTRMWLNGHAESVEDFQIHRLRSAKSRCEVQGVSVKRWRLLREACIRKELITPKIEMFLRSAEE